MSLFTQDLFYHPESAGARPLVGCSACLLGEAVRYDGGHKEQAHFEKLLLPWVQLQAICPEVGIGLGVPRPTLKVVGDEAATEVVFVEEPDRAVTAELQQYADNYLHRIDPFWPLTAFIFKARSPSCGVGSTPINPETADEYSGYGAFAERFARQAPWLPLFEEEQLPDAARCREFLLKSFICRDVLWQGETVDTAALLDHYRMALGVELEHTEGRLGAWQLLRASLDMMDQDATDALVERYRASEARKMTS